MNTTANLGKAPVRTLVLQLAIPSMTAQFVNVLYSIIDRMYIGHISENGALALAGAGICGPIVTLLTSFGTLVGIGGSITMGIRMGEKNHKKAEQVLANSFLMCLSVLLPESHSKCIFQFIQIPAKQPFLLRIIIYAKNTNNKFSVSLLQPMENNIIRNNLILHV